ncbi:MAG: branched-chain amino acid transporter permease [Formosimonas sp.]
MSLPEILTMIAVMGAITWGLRAAPFFFQGFLTRHPFIGYIKNRFPLMMMLILVVYASEIYQPKSWEQLRPTLLAIGLTAAIQLLCKNYLLSLFAGIALYVLLVNHWL